jgi:intracellular septation protein
VLALVNEYVWRSYDEADWVFYKTFIAAPASALFMLAQLPITLRGLATARKESSNQ